MTKTMTKKIAIVCGGISGERDISLASGKAVEAACAELKHKTTLIDAGADLPQQLLTAAPDIIFNALHGQWGESGQVQGLFEVMGIPYTHSGVLASALAMDKAKAKTIFESEGLPVAPHVLTTRALAESTHQLEPPYVIKPLGQGSSLGVVIVEAGANKPPSLTNINWQWGDAVMIEKYIAGREFSCAVLRDRVLGIAEIIPAAGTFYDYKQKYDSDGAQHIVPAKVNKTLTKQIEEISLTAHKVLSCCGATRCDFRYNEKTNQLALLELNTQPGMTSASLVPEIASRVAGMEMKSLVRSLLEEASCNK